MNTRIFFAFAGNSENYILALQSLLLALKYVFAYGDFSTVADFDDAFSVDDYFSIVKLSLMSIDLLDYGDFISEHFLYGSYHLNQLHNLGNEIARAYYVFVVLAKEKSNFPIDVQNEYLDFNSDFITNYGYSISEYLATVFLLTEHDIKTDDKLFTSPIYRNINTAYQYMRRPEIPQNIIEDLSHNEEIRNWAEKTIDAWWNFSQFMESPVIMLPDGSFSSISDRTLGNAIYEKLFWHIRSCYPKASKKFNSFIGRPFEKYIQIISNESIIGNQNYKFIDEFKFETRESKDNASSDAYIIKGNQMIIIEGKSYFPLFDSINYCDDESIKKSIKKLFICPVLQADEANTKLLSSSKKELFNGIDEITIISVTGDCIQAVPNYMNDAIKEIFSKKKLSNLIQCLNLSIREYEFLLSMIESDIDVFTLIKSYLNQSTIQPFFTYASQVTKHENVRTKFITQIFSDAIVDMNNLLFEKSDEQYR